MVREDFIGLSSETKRTDVANGSTFYEADTSKAYVFYDGEWYEKVAEGGGGGGEPETYGVITYLDGGVQKTVTMTYFEDFMKLTKNITVTIDNISIAPSNIIGVEVSDGVSFLPNSFCNRYTRLETVSLPDTIIIIENNVFQDCVKLNSTLNLKNVEYIGDNFLRTYNESGAIFNQPLNMPNIEHIGTWFNSNNQVFNSAITIGNNCRFIGEQFLRVDYAFAQPLTIPSSVTSIGQYFINDCKNFTTLECNSSVSPTDNNSLSTTDSTAVCYTTGITLKGTYASDWKTNLPDRTSSPYRKLILGA